MQILKIKQLIVNNEQKTEVLIKEAQNMKIDEHAVESMAHKSCIELTEKELRAFTEELGEILRYVKKLDNVNTEGISPTAINEILQAVRASETKSNSQH